jgi:hypothetical protein
MQYEYIYITYIYISTYRYRRGRVLVEDAVEVELVVLARLQSLHIKTLLRRLNRALKES